MNIVLYTTGCPKCKILEAKLAQKGIEFSIEENLDEMIALGYQSAPLLKVDDNIMEFGAAVKWANRLGEVC